MRTVLHRRHAERNDDDRLGVSAFSASCHVSSPRTRPCALRRLRAHQPGRRSTTAQCESRDHLPHTVASLAFRRLRRPTDCTLDCDGRLDAERYHEISTPQQEWGRRVLDRLPLAGTEHVLDIGCGTGRLTEEIAARLPRGRVVGLDRSAAMLETAAAWLRENSPPTSLVLADGAALPFRRAFDAIFSGATFHWIHDHAALFRSIITALRPGGRLVAQCGGGPNLALLYARADRLMREARFARYFEEWTEPDLFRRRRNHPAPSRRARASSTSRCRSRRRQRPSTDRINSMSSSRRCACATSSRCCPAAERQSFLRDLTVAAAGDSPAFTLDYWRLNISGRRPA